MFSVITVQRLTAVFANQRLLCTTAAKGLAVVLLAVVLLASLQVYSVHADDRSAALTMISDTADRICGIVTNQGETRSSRVSGNVQTELSGLARYLASIGLSGAGEIASLSYQNVLQQDLAATLRDVRTCKLKIFDRLVEIVFPTPMQITSPPPVPGMSKIKPPYNSYQYFFEGEWRVIIQGKQQKGFAAGMPNDLWPDRNQARSYIWNIRRDASNIYIMSAEDRQSHALDNPSGASRYNNWQRLNIGNIIYDRTKLDFDVYEENLDKGARSVTKVSLYPSNDSNLISGEWQYKYSKEDIHLGSSNIQKSGTLYMRQLSEESLLSK